jgi:hypothetical protein
MGRDRFIWSAAQADAAKAPAPGGVTVSMLDLLDCLGRGNWNGL